MTNTNPKHQLFLLRKNEAYNITEDTPSAFRASF